MAETENTNTEEIKEEVKEEVNEEVKEEEVQEVSDEEAKKSTVDKIKDLVKSVVSPDSKEEKEGELIPGDFSAAASKLGWTDQDITEFSSDYSDDELLEMIPTLLGENSVETEKASDKTDDKSETKETKGEDSQDDEATKKLLERIDALEKGQGVAKEKEDKQELDNRVHRASQMFDETSKEFEVFGKTEDLPVFPDGHIIPTSPQMKARTEVWDVAVSLNKAGMDFDNALSVSLNAYKGKNLSADVKRNIIKDLKKSEKKLSGKHTSHESQATITNGPDVIREVVRRAGKDIN